MGNNIDVAKCLKCGEEKSLVDFHKNKNRRLGVSAVCRLCSSSIGKLYYKNNRDACIEKAVEYRRKNPLSKEKTRSNKMKYLYGIDFKFFDEYISSHPECCVCLTKWGSGMRGPAVDHDHIANKFRGIICRRCNAGIGLLGDSISGLTRATAYLAKTMETR